MKSSVLLLTSLVVPTVATFAKLDQWHVQKYSAAGCNAANKIQDDFLELGVCNQDDAITWKKAVVTSNVYTLTRYNDSACTMVNTSLGTHKLNATCTKKDNTWQTGVVVKTLDTFRSWGDFSDSACTTRKSGEYGFSYHAMNTCQQTGSTSIKYVCTADTIIRGDYKTKDCTGTRNTTCGADCFTITSGDKCTAFPKGNEKFGKYYKVNCGPIAAEGATSGAQRICSQGLTPLLLATIAVVMSF